jgi:hypothetical protein
MEKITAAISICLLWLNSSHGQGCLYEIYFKLCGAAHADYASNRPEAAADTYKLAFRSVDFSLGTDLQNALIVARQTQDTTWAYEIARLLARGGVPLEYFGEFEHYKWYDQFAAEFASLRAYYAATFDHVARQKFLALCLQDSIFNSSYHAFRTGKLDLSLDELIDGATVVLDSLKALIHLHGFPCEQLMGYYYQDGAVGKYPITPLLIHIYQCGELFYIDRLPVISCDGKLRPVDAFDISRFRGLGDSTGIEQEMSIRWQKYRGGK